MIVQGFYKETEELGCLSNWYKSAFTYAGIHYSCAEQYMMYQKAMLFDDETVAKQILETDDTYEMKSLGRLVHHYNDALWRKLSYRIMYKGIKAKFLENDDLRKILFSTKDNILAECAPRDYIWGIGMTSDDPEIQDTSKWKGSNKLGALLMEVREDLRREFAIFKNLKYIDAKDKDFELWHKRPGDLRRNSLYYMIIHTYVDSFQSFDKEVFYYEKTLAEWEEELEKGETALPRGGFYELKQELYDVFRLSLNDYENRYEKLPVITKRQVAWQNATRNEHGILSMGYPLYDEETKEWMQLLEEMNLMDPDYLKNYDHIMGKDPCSLSVDEILTFLTFVIRSERYNAGALAKLIEDGTIEKLGKRIRKLTR